MRKKVLIISFYFVLFAVSVFVGYLIGIYRKIQVTKQEPIAANMVDVGPTPTPDPMAPKNILLLGSGGADHSGGALTDAIILARVYPRDEKVVLISIPRDIWISLPGGEEKINEAYYQGGSVLVKQAVSKVIGMPIDYFVSVDFSGFKSIVDLLEGVEVDVPYAFSDEYYPVWGLENESCGKTAEEIEALTASMGGYLLERQFKCRYETIEFEKEKTLMDGETALQFVRSRHSEVGGSDFGRSIRQQALLKAVKDKVLSLSSVDKIIPLINEASEYLKTDLDIGAAIELLRDYTQIPDVPIQTISLSTDNVLEESISSAGQYILLAQNNDWKQVHEFIAENLN